MMATRVLTLSLALVSAVVLGCRGAPCISSAQCGDGVCSGGVCRGRSASSSSSGSLFGDGGVVRRDAGVDGGNLDAGGLDAAGLDAAGLDANVPLPDAAGFDAAVTVDSGPFTITTANPPTSLTFNETGTALLVATGGNGAIPAHVDSYTIPYNGLQPVGVDLGVQPLLTCINSVLISRGNFLYTGCSTAPYAVRGFNAGNGTQVTTDDAVRVVQATPLGLNHANLVGVASGAGTGGFFFSAPASDATRGLVGPNNDQANVGVALLENTAGNVTAAVTVGNSVSEFRYWTYDGTVFTLNGAPIPLAGVATLEYLTSGPRGTQAKQPVVTVNATMGQIVVMDGLQLQSAATGAPVVVVYSYEGQDIPAAGAVRMKVSPDGRYAYEFNRALTRLCRWGMQSNPQAFPDCVDLPSACSPSDVAPRTRNSPTAVACQGLSQVAAFPGF